MENKKTIKISKKALQGALKEMAENLSSSILTESNHFSAMRTIEHSATSTSMEFEKSIVDVLGLEHPDNYQPELQKKYYEIVQIMKAGIVSAVMDAANQLVTFPKTEGKK